MTVDVDFDCIKREASINNYAEVLMAESSEAVREEFWVFRTCPCESSNIGRISLQLGVLLKAGSQGLRILQADVHTGTVWFCHFPNFFWQGARKPFGKVMVVVPCMPCTPS